MSRNTVTTLANIGDFSDFIRNIDRYNPLAIRNKKLMVGS